MTFGEPWPLRVILWVYTKAHSKCHWTYSSREMLAIHEIREFSKKKILAVQRSVLNEIHADHCPVCNEHLFQTHVFLHFNWLLWRTVSQIS